MDAASRFVLPGALLLITYAAGIWLTTLGRPYQGLPFNLHKLIALAAVVFAVFRIYELRKGGPDGRHLAGHPVVKTRPFAGSSAPRRWRRRPRARAVPHVRSRTAS